MGVIADEVLLHNGEVIGIIPIFLVDRELSHPNLTRLEVVHSMPVRKKMIELGNCYIALQGGPEILEEISEVISWARIGQHQNPCVLLNVE
ncbi:MAG: LOG family protein [Solibacillus sp.]